MTKILSDEKRRSLWLEFNVDYETIYAIEAAVLEAQGKQKPVAWMVVTADDKLVFINANQAEHYAKQWELEVCPLFAAPVVQEKQEPWPFSADRVTYTKHERSLGAEKAMASDLRERNAAWWALVMGAAAALEDAANFLSGDAKRAASLAANHYRREANALWPNANVCGLPHGKEDK